MQFSTLINHSRMQVTKILFKQVGKLTEKYLKRNTGTSESYKDISTVPFPVLTICPTYPYRDERIAYHGVDIVRDIQVMN